jgi:putative phage-type endonuclease
MQLDRSKGIGCSDLPAIMDVSPWSNPYKLWKEKVTGKSEQKDNAAMKYGRETEPLIRELAEKKAGFSLNPEVVFHPKKPWMWASLDGYNPDKKVIGEFKTANKDDHLLTISGKVPEKYWPQVQGQMEVVGSRVLLYCSYYDGDLEVLSVAHDPDYCAEMMAKADAFWECVALEKPPEGYICAKDNQEWNDTAQELDVVKSQIKALSEQDKALIEKLKGLSEGFSTVGNSFMFEKTEVNGNIDYKAAIEAYLDGLRTRYPDIIFEAPAYDLYRKKSFEKWILKGIKK